MMSAPMTGWMIAFAAVLCFLAGYCVSKESYWRGRWDQAAGIEAKGWMRE